MAGALGGVDALVFTGGIGEHAGAIRAKVCQQLQWLGVDFDAAANEAGNLTLATPISRIKVWVIPTNEELVIAEDTQAILQGVFYGQDRFRYSFE